MGPNTTERPKQSCVVNILGEGRSSEEDPTSTSCAFLLGCPHVWQKREYSKAVSGVEVHCKFGETFKYFLC